jgi:hypothetical protein
MEVASGISVTVSLGFAWVSWPCSCVAAFCSNSSADFFLLLGGIDDLEDE